MPLAFEAREETDRGGEAWFIAETPKTRSAQSLIRWLDRREGAEVSRGCAIPVPSSVSCQASRRPAEGDAQRLKDWLVQVFGGGPDQRFQSAGDLGIALKRLIGGEIGETSLARSDEAGFGYP